MVQLFASGSGAAAEVEVGELEPALNVEAKLRSEGLEVAAGFVLFEQVAVEAAKRAEGAAEGDVDVERDGGGGGLTSASLMAGFSFRNFLPSWRVTSPINSGIM